LPAAASASDDVSGNEGSGDHTPGALESAEGGAPEIMVHGEERAAAPDELSPEEQAVHPVGDSGNGGSESDREEPMTPNDEESDVAALAEGREVPPGASGNEPK